MESLELTDNSRELHEYLLKIIRIAKTSAVLMGKTLYELKQGDKFKTAVGAGADNWDDYLKQPEIGLHRHEANRFIQIYELMVLKWGYDEDTISEIPVKNLHYLLPLAKKAGNKDEVDGLVADATLLSQKDFKEKIFDKKVEEGNVSDTFEYLIMKKYDADGHMTKVHEISSDMIRSAFNLE